MMKHLRNEQGVALVLELFLVGAVLIVAGLAIYASYHNKKPTPAVAIGTPTPPASKTHSPTPSVNSNAGYIVITQWGVKLPATGELASLRYKIADTSAPWYSPDASARFYSTELYPKYQLCGEGGLGSLTRVAASSDTGTVGGIKAGTVNGFDYYYSTAQQPCVQGDPAPYADEQLETNQMNTLAQEMRQLKLAGVQ